MYSYYNCGALALFPVASVDMMSHASSLSRTTHVVYKCWELCGTHVVNKSVVRMWHPWFTTVVGYAASMWFICETVVSFVGMHVVYNSVVSYKARMWFKRLS